jgi:multiple sugar transport system permease protein
MQMNTNNAIKRNKKIFLCIKIAFAVLLGVLLLLPIYAMFISSVKPTAEVYDMKLIPETISFEGYRYALQGNFIRSFLNSLFISTTVTVVALIFHAMAGYTLARVNFTGKKFVFLWIISTLMVPFSVIMIPLFIMVKEFGWLNTYQGVIIPAIPHAFGIFLFRQFFLTVPKDLSEAATIDGCSNFRIFTKIYLPLSKSICITLAVSFFIANWNNYLWPLIVAQDEKMWVLQVAISNFIGRNGARWDAVMAAGVIAVIPTIAMFFALQKYLVEGIKMSGIK